ncbi:MAG: tryptophan--tRNA ligase [Candidatus Liptonbacteria bacterium]|nr:tryptophan--tRNA ligase [Candidatus Liptonbacteria bacterium]
MSKPILISGIQPTGRLHIGNYLGALKNFVELQNSGKYKCYFFIADLHSLTESFSPAEKHKQILELAADYIAAGLNPKKSTIFLQSQVSAHAELAWIFETLTSLGELKRMTQFKEKSEKEKERVNAGLLTYPALMASDILLYDAAFVPVGEDQLQHLELARTLARKFNKRFGKTFVEPKPILTESPRVMSITHPKKKMAKSEPSGCLFLDDSPQEIKAKISRAVTDSGSEIKLDPAKKAGISNLLRIYSSLSGERIPMLEKKYTGKNYSEFKRDLAELVADYFSVFRKKKKQLQTTHYQLQTILKSGSAKASQIAEKKTHEVKKKIGIEI